MSFRDYDCESERRLDQLIIKKLRDSLRKERERLQNVIAIHDEYDGPHTYCHECGGLTPCETRRLATAEGDET